MMRLTFGIAAILLLLTSGLCAQPDTTRLHEAKMKMIREAVNFYSLDTKLSEKPINCEATEVAGLKKCAAGMDGVSSKIEKWNKLAVTDELALKALATTIIDEITVGPEKQHRLKISGYKDFESRINELGGTKAAQVDMTSEESQTTPPAPTVNPGSTPVPQSAGAVIEPATAAIEPSSAATGPIWKDPFILSCVAIVLSLIALVVALMAKNRKSHRRSGSSRETPPVFQEYSSPGSQLNLVALEEKITRLSSELDSANEIIREMDRRLTGKVQQLETKETDYAPRQEQTASATQFSANKKWAKNVDGGGFEMDALSPEPDSKMIYEITQTGSQTATFKVSETREAQLFALTNPQNYLREGCNYTSQPSSNSQIRTEVPGTLELQGRKWRITNPAQITFS